MNESLESYLAILKQFGIENNIPNVTEIGGRFLHMLVLMNESKSVLEIGSANGYSTLWLSDAVRQNGGRVTSIDFSAPTYQQAKKNIDEAGFSDIVDFHFGNALSVIPDFPNGTLFDFVFVDGEKRSYFDFWKVIQPFLEPCAVIIFDDVLAFPDKTQPFLQSIKSVKGFSQVLLPIDEGDGVLLMRKEE